MPVSQSLEHFDTQTSVEGILPPTTKEGIFKWAFQIPENCVVQHEKEAVNHLLKVFHPFTGKTTTFSY